MQRVSLLCRGSAGLRERPAAVDAETMRKQGIILEHLMRMAGEFPHRMCSGAEGFQNPGFDGVLRVLSAAAGRKRPAGGTLQGVRWATAGDREGRPYGSMARSVVCS